MQRLLPGLIAASVIAAVNTTFSSQLFRPLLTELDLHAFRGRLPQAQLSIADKARRHDAERSEYLARTVGRVPVTLGDYRRSDLAMWKRQRKAIARAASKAAGGWTNGSRQVREPELAAA